MQTFEIKTKFTFDIEKWDVKLNINREAKNYNSLSLTIGNPYERGAGKVFFSLLEDTDTQ